MGTCALIGRALGAITISLALSSCAGNSEDGSGLPADIRAMAAAATGFEAEILSDGKITVAEYREAVDLHMECMRNRGYEAHATYDADGLAVLSVQSQSSPDEDLEACAQGTHTAVIDAVFEYQVYGSAEEQLERLIGCLRKRGLLSPDATESDYYTWLNEDQANVEFVVECGR